MPSPPPDKAAPIAVNVAQAYSSDWQNSVSSYGTVYAMEGTDLTTDVAGKVTAILFHSGEQVVRGQTLVTLENEDLSGQVLKDQANLELMKIRLKQSTYLQKIGAIAALEYDTAVADYESAVGTLQMDQAQLQKTLITAPFSGVVGLRNVNLGQYITPGAVIVNLQQTDQAYVDFAIPQDQAEQARLGDRVVVSIDEGKNVFEGKLVASDAALHTDSRTLMMRATLADPHHRLKPGMYAMITLYLGQKQTSVTVPSNAIVYSPTTNGVYVVKAGHAVLIPVVVGERRENEAQILQGVEVGQTIVTSGQSKLFPGASVTVVPDVH